MEEDPPKKDDKVEVDDEPVKKDPVPPLEAAARRLERLLGGGLSDNELHFLTHSNPAKVVRRWLGTSSGAAAEATASDIASAARKLLDPKGPCAGGREILLSGLDEAMDVDSQKEETVSFLTMASCREVESWLISLSVRLLRNESKLQEAFELAQKGISILLGHLESASTNLTSLSGVSTSSLFPCLARTYRYRSLVAEDLSDEKTTASLRQDLVKAHNLSCLRRDVDCQATLLNLMLRDFLLNSQSKFSDDGASGSSLQIEMLNCSSRRLSVEK